MFRFVSVSFLALFLTGCSAYLGRELVTAPNLDLPIRGQDAPPSLMKTLCITEQLRVPVDRDT